MIVLTDNRCTDVPKAVLGSACSRTIHGRQHKIATNMRVKAAIAAPVMIDANDTVSISDDPLGRVVSDARVPTVVPISPASGRGVHHVASAAGSGSCRSGSLRVAVDAGIDPCSRKRHFLREIVPAGPNAERAVERVRRHRG